MARFQIGFRTVAGPIVASLTIAAIAVSCGSNEATISDDADPKTVSASRLAFETDRPLVVGSSIPVEAPLVVAFTAGARLDRGSLISIAFPTAVQEEAGDLWSIPATTAGASGFCRPDDESARTVEIASAGRVKGGAGRIVLRVTSSLESGATVRVLVTGQVPKIVPRRPFRVIELDSRTGALSRLPDASVSLPPVVAAPAVRLLATLPSDRGPREAATLRLAALDEFGNVDGSYRGDVRLTGPFERLPASVTFTEVDRGLKSVAGIVGVGTGIARVTLTATVAAALSTVQSNPMQMWASAPRWRRFVGDAHFHSGSDVAKVSTDGGDHRGQFVASADAFTYLRDAAGADWGISAEHDTGLSDETWMANQQRVASVEEKDRFVTLIGYEWTPPRRLGHHVVVFEGSPGESNSLVGAASGRRGGEGATSVAELVTALRSTVSAGHRVLLIPHVMQPFPNEDADRDEHALPHAVWDGPDGTAPGAYVFNDLRRVGEVYSHHNDDFTTDGYRQTREGRGDAVNQPQLFETGVGNAWSYQHAWATGHRVGVIGGSDNHFGTPGLNDYVPTVPHHSGLAVVLASALEHESIFSALYDRRCYATTGARILVSLDVDGLAMGEEAQRPHGSRLPIRVDVAGTSTIVSVEIMKFVGGDFVALRTQLVRANEMDVSVEIVDTVEASTLYYVRVRQSDGEWAWTSPVWIDVATSSP